MATAASGGEFIPLIIGEHNYLLNKRIKKVFDPHGILNPGKITDTPPTGQLPSLYPGKAHARAEDLV